MPKLNKIVDYLNEYLEIEEIDDDSWNGLQVEGEKEVSRVAFSVTAGMDVFRAAKKENADMIVVHHGLFWKKANPSLKGWKKDRVKFLLENKISLYACHLPLDRHLTVGNNAQILKFLKAQPKKPMENKEKNIGWIGECRETSIEEIKQRIEEKFSTKCILLDYGKRKVKKIGVISGGAPHGVFGAIEKEVDLFITGDPSDITEVVKDAKINVIFAGHYASETVGVKAVSEVLRKEFNIETVFIDAPTGL